jgi:hypothetical protein
VFLYLIFNNINIANPSSIWVLLTFALTITLVPFILIYALKENRKKYFIISSIWIILSSAILFFFGKNILNFFNIKSGLVNSTMYLYKYVFMFSPFLSIFFVSLHKIWKEKKQLIFLIALKYFLPILLIFIFMNILKFSSLLWLFAITDFVTSLFSLLLALKN